jgi:hypothetical protein
LTFAAGVSVCTNTSVSITTTNTSPAIHTWIGYALVLDIMVYISNTSN